ncbi:MAG: YdiU family protein [Bacteroidia bacterium]|nr:YdiU family protein [Bacteroidia bacterium]
MAINLFKNINDTFSLSLPADEKLENHIRQVRKAAYSFVNPTPPSNPSLIAVSKEVGQLLGLSEEDLQSDAFLEMFSGSSVHTGTKPYAMCYGGHQFGQWAGQLGDGRAINLAEVVQNDQRWALQIKGAGLTPYSRSADGLAVLRSSIREYLCSEAMHHLGVPTTRALSLVLTGDEVLRDIMYDGNSAYEKGAIVCRVSPSFVRFGNFQMFAAQRDHENLRKLADYTIQYFYPELGTPSKDAYIAFFKAVVERTLAMIIHWQRVGFVHGVMNTDNMSILGLTIDYGPYGWLEDYDPNWTPNTTDRQTRRYRFGHQPQVALWNLAQLANALYPLVEEQEPFVEILEGYKTSYSGRYYDMMSAKLGIEFQDASDIKLIQELVDTLQLTETDMTIFFRRLTDYSTATIYSDDKVLDHIKEAFYAPQELQGDVLESWYSWIKKYLDRLKMEKVSDEERRSNMNMINPKYVLRNYMAQLAIEKAEEGNYDLLSEIYQLLLNPYEEQPENEKWFTRRPDWARHKVGSSMLSCSS